MGSGGGERERREGKGRSRDVEKYFKLRISRFLPSYAFETGLDGNKNNTFNYLALT